MGRFLGGRLPWTEGSLASDMAWDMSLIEHVSLYRWKIEALGSAIVQAPRKVTLPHSSG